MMSKTSRLNALAAEAVPPDWASSDRISQLEQVVERYLSFYNHAPVGFATLSDQGVLIELNLAASTLAGVPRERAIGKPLMCYVDRRDRQLLGSHITRMAGGTASTELRLKGGQEPVPVQLVTTRAVIPGTEVVNYHAVIIDVRARVRAEEALRTSERHHREIVETATEGICIVDRSNTIVFANRQMARIAETTVEQLLGCSAFLLLPPDDRPAEEAAFAEAGNHSAGQTDQRLLRGDGSIVWTSVSKTARYDERGHFIGMLLMYTDASARHQLGEIREMVVRQLVATQEQERQRIARELHDQMGQHIVALSLGVSRLTGLCQDVPHAVAILDELKQTADRLGQDVHRLALELRPAALDHLGLAVALVDYAESTARRAQFEVDVHCDDVGQDPADVVIHTGIYRIAQEALTNVVKHACAHRVSVILEARGEQLTLIVEDDGVGFGSGRGGPEPTRLGLAGMQERATLLGGTLTIESTPGKGTAVYLRIPAPSKTVKGRS